MFITAQNISIRCYELLTSVSTSFSTTGLRDKTFMVHDVKKLFLKMKFTVNSVKHEQNNNNITSLAPEKSDCSRVVSYHRYVHPADKRVSAPVTAFSPLSVGFLHKFRKSKIPMAASVKSAPSTSASSKLVPVKTALVKIALRKLEPLKVARSTTAFVKSVPSKLLSKVHCRIHGKTTKS